MSDTAPERPTYSPGDPIWWTERDDRVAAVVLGEPVRDGGLWMVRIQVVDGGALYVPSSQLTRRSESQS